MRSLAYAFLAAGTVLGSLGGARVPRVEWSFVAAGVALLVVALLLLRRADGGGGGGAGGSTDGGLAPVRDRVRALADALDALLAEANGLPLAVLRDRLGELERDFLRPLGDEVPALLPRLGAATFAQACGTYAAGERAVRRAWSAATDGHRPEALEALRLGTRRIRDATEAL